MSDDLSFDDDLNYEEVFRAQLEDYELEGDDYLLLDDDALAADIDGGARRAPVVAVVGRPNVGKSTLVNRIVGKRVAVVQDVPGVTRDRVNYPAHWAGRDFLVMDTGGWEYDVKGLDRSVAEQAEIAVDLADAVVFVVDATVGSTETDDRVVQLLRKSGKPVILAANKVDSPLQEADAAMLWSLGLGEPYPVSALHGRGTGDLLDAVLDALPEEAASGTIADPSIRRIALVGRPNVGKSSMLNQLAGHERVVVNSLAGTTRDPVDETIDIEGRQWMFVDTAGIRRRVHQTFGADYYASLRTQAALEKAELGLALIDASVDLTEQDVRVIQTVIDTGRALVIVCNKWDLVDEERQAILKRQLEKDLVQVGWAPRINVSAKTGWHMNRLVKAMDIALESWGTRIPTGKLNSFFGELVAAHPHPVRGGKQPRILFATQASSCPPRFVIFASGFIEAGYRRFLENRLRERFGFEGSPIEISVRVRERRKKK